MTASKIVISHVFPSPRDWIGKRDGLTISALETRTADSNKFKNLVNEWMDTYTFQNMLQKPFACINKIRRLTGYGADREKRFRGWVQNQKRENKYKSCMCSVQVNIYSLIDLQQNQNIILQNLELHLLRCFSTTILYYARTKNTTKKVTMNIW